MVYHVNYDDQRKHSVALQNIQNHIDAMGGPERIEIKVVLHGGGLSLLLHPDSLDYLDTFRYANATEALTARVASLKAQGVRFLVCGRTMQRRGVQRERDLYDVNPEDIVPNGLAEIARLQELGYVYLKP